MIPRLRARTRALYILGAAGVVALCQMEPASAAVQTFVGVAPAVSSTSFETGEQVDLTIVPITLGMRGSRASIRAWLPYLDLSAQTPAYRVGGPILGLTVPEQRFDEQGPGDIVVTPAYLLVRGGLDTPSLWANLRVKAPTGDETKYLGSGETDYAPGFGLLVPTQTRTMLFASARYNFRGDPPDVDLQDTVSASLGAIVRAGTLEAISVFVARDEARFEGGDPSNALGVSWYHPFNNGTAFSATGLVGQAAEARTYGIALGITFNDGPYDWGN